MANRKASQLATATALDGTEKLYVVQGGVSKQTDVGANLATLKALSAQAVANLVEYSGVNPGEAGLALAATATQQEILDYLGIKVSEFPTKAAAIAASPLTTFVRFFGIATQGDYGGVDALYEFTASTPSHDHYITCANGRKYVRVPPPAGTPCNVAEIGLLSGRGIGVDSTPDLNKVFTAALSSNCKYWAFPDIPSSYHFNTKPNAMPPMRLEGPGMKDTFSLYKNFVSTNPYDGIFNLHISGTFLRRMRIVGLEGSQDPSASNAGTGCGVSIIANVTDDKIGYGEVDEIEVTSDATLPNGHACLAYDFYWDGNATAAPGVRAVPMTKMKLFGAELGSIYGKSHVGGMIGLLGTYTAGGLTGKVWLDGSSGKSGGGTVFNASDLQGGIDLKFQNGLTMNLGITSGVIDIAASCQGVTINGTMSFVTSIANLSTTTKFSDIPHLSGRVTLGTSPAAQNYGTGRSFLLTPEMSVTPIGAAGLTASVTTNSSGGWTGVASAAATSTSWTAVGTINAWVP